jgi:hypothetical protein
MTSNDPMSLSASVRMELTGCADTAALAEAPRKDLSPAAWMYMRLAQAIAAFEKKLDAEHEVGLRLVSFAENQVLHIENMGYWSPDLLLFYGKNGEEAPVQLMQHVSQVSVLLVAAKKQRPAEPARRIGFEILRKVEEAVAPEKGET